MSRIRKLLTFSNVVAAIALFIALGGTVYAAGKINGKQVKPNSLPGNRIKPKTITANRIKPKTLTGKLFKAHSIKGAQIDQSTLKGVSAASLSGVQYVVASVSLVSFAPSTGTAGCPTGTYVIGGGATVSDEERAYVNDSGPNQSRTGWTATGFGFGAVHPTMNVTAICMAIKTPVGSGPPLPPAYHPVG